MIFIIPEKLRHLPERLRQLRLDAGISQSSLALKAELTGAYISQVEKGKIVPSLQALVKLAEIFGIETEELVKTNKKTDFSPKIQNITESNTIFDFYKGVNLYNILDDIEMNYRIIYGYLEDNSIIKFKTAINSEGVLIVNSGKITVFENGGTESLIKAGQFYTFCKGILYGGKNISKDKAEFTIFLKGKMFL